MTDEVYVYYNDIREKKRTATGAYHVKRGSRSKKCTLPSDYLSRKEIEKMNGEVTTVKLNEPMSWEEFKSLSPTLQTNYLNHLIVHHAASISSIGTEMFGLAGNTFYNYLHSHGITHAKATRRGKSGTIKWNNFLKNGSKRSNATEPESALDYSNNPDGEFVNLELDTSKIISAQSEINEKLMDEASWGTDIRPQVTSALEFDFTLDNVTDWNELRKLIARLEGISLEGGYRITLRVQRSGE